MRVVAQRGPGTVLVEVEEDGEAVVLNRRSGQVLRVPSRDAAMKFGYWTPFEGDEEAVLREVRRALGGRRD